MQIIDSCRPKSAKSHVWAFKFVRMLYLFSIRRTSGVLHHTSFFHAHLQKQNVLKTLLACGPATVSGNAIFLASGLLSSPTAYTAQIAA